MESRAERWTRIAEARERHYMRLLATKEVQELRAAPEFDKVKELLSRRKRRQNAVFDDPPEDLDLWIFQAVKQALAAPDLAETMTGKERRKVAASIRQHCESLSELLKPFQRQGLGFAWPFQPCFDLLALDASIEQTKDWDRPLDELGEIQHQRRYGIYSLLMDSMDDVLATIVEGGDWFADSETLIKKPNDPNAKRLYFLRVLTRRLCGEFKSPCRAASLALASVYFDCSDLDEASVSKLAPVERREPVEIPREAFEEMIESMTKRIESLDNPEAIEELTEGVNLMKQMLTESSG